MNCSKICWWGMTMTLIVEKQACSESAILIPTLPVQDPPVDHISPNPVPSQPPPTPHMENKPEPTADGELLPAVMHKSKTKNEPAIAWEPDPQSESDLVYEPATSMPEVLLPTLPSPESSVPSLSPLTQTCSKSYVSRRRDDASQGV